jgi:hypothetical protein
MMMPVHIVKDFNCFRFSGMTGAWRKRDMVNPSEAGFILRGNARLSDPILPDSDPAAEAEQRLSEPQPSLV